MYFKNIIKGLKEMLYGLSVKEPQRLSLASETLNQSLPNLTEKIYEQLSNLIKAHSYENKYSHI